MIASFYKQFSLQPKAGLLALPAFVAVESKATLGEIFDLEHEDGTYEESLVLCFDSTKGEVDLDIEVQKIGQSQFLIKKCLNFFDTRSC